MINIYEEPQLQLNFLFYNVPAGVLVSARQCALIYNECLQAICKQSAAFQDMTISFFKLMTTIKLKAFEERLWDYFSYCIGMMLQYLQPTRQTTVSGVKSI